MDPPTKKPTSLLHMQLSQPSSTHYSVIPGKSLGDRFVLGTPISDVLDMLRKASSQFPKVELKYSDTTPLKVDIILNLPLNGISLRFDPILQQLKSIQVYDFTRLTLSFQHQEFNSCKHIPTLALIYKLLGPIYPGSYQETSTGELVYTLKYPGISFVFPIPTSFAHLAQELPISFPDGSTPVLNRLYIHQQEGQKSLIHPVQVFPKKGICIKGIWILLNQTTAQDVIADLERPCQVFIKEQDKIKMPLMTDSLDSLHLDPEGLGGTTGVHAADYFMNYFHYGLDLMMDGQLHTVKKIILHTNLPSLASFSRYRRCFFEFAGQDGIHIDYTTLMPDILNQLGPPPSAPIIYNRQVHEISHGPSAVSSTSWFQEYDSVVFEYIKNGHLASVTLVGCI